MGHFKNGSSSNFDDERMVGYFGNFSNFINVCAALAQEYSYITKLRLFHIYIFCIISFFIYLLHFLIIRNIKCDLSFNLVLEASLN